MTFGLGDAAEIGWDGSPASRGNGELVELIGYEMGLADLIHPPRRWEMSTRPAFQFNRRNHDEDILVDLPPETYLTPRFYVYLRGSSATRVSFETEQGSFDLRVGDVPQVGAIKFLQGRASVARAPLAMLLGRGDPGAVDERLTDNDFASLEVAEDDTIWVAYSGIFGRGGPRVRRPRTAGPIPGQRDGPTLSARSTAMSTARRSRRMAKARSGSSGPSR